MMLEDLGLPWLEQKEQQVELETEETVFHDISKKGLPPNVDRRRTILRNLRRNIANNQPGVGGFIPEDLRFRVWENVLEKHSNASVILAMDRSGSMTLEKKFIVKSFFFWMVNFIRRKYQNVEVVFVAYDTVAREVGEENFFAISEGGGTMISSGFKLAKEIVEARFPPDAWNNYVFCFSDGENWDDDNGRCVVLVKELLGMCQAVGYGEVSYSDEFYNWASFGGSWFTLHKEFSRDNDLSEDPRFMTASIVKREDLYACLKQFLDVDEGKGKR